MRVHGVEVQFALFVVRLYRERYVGKYVPYIRKILLYTIDFYYTYVAGFSSF